MESPRLYHRVEVVYLLSRGDQLEHPHVIQVPYPSHQEAPTLKDVKARLTALRGKGMPESYSWSSKRNYKDTFIWCDLFEDDFILPLPGSGEYVLKAVELFNASQDQAEEFHSARKISPIKDLAATTRPAKTSSRQSTKLEQQQVESDNSSASSDNALLIGDVGNLTSDSSMELNQQMMDCLSRSKTAPDVCSLDHSDVSDSSHGTYPSEEAIESKSCSGETKLTKKTAISGDVSPSQRDIVTMDVNVGPTSPTCNNGEMPSFSLRPTAIPREGSVKRRTWNLKEADKNIIFTAPESSRSLSRSGQDGDYSSPVVSLEDMTLSPCAPCLPGQDPFLFVLKKAIRLGGYRPRLCRNIDVVESQAVHRKYEEPSSTRHTSKILRQIGSKAKQAIDRAILEKTSSEVSSRTDQKPQKMGNFSPERPQKEVQSLSDFLRTSESRSSAFTKTVWEGKSVAGSSRKHSGSARPETTRGVSGGDYASRRREVVTVVPEAVPHAVSLGGAKKARPDAKGKLLLELVSSDTKSSEVVITAPAPHAILVPTVSKPQAETGPKEKQLAPKQRRPVVAAGSQLETAADCGETFIIGDVPTTVKTHEQKTIIVPRNLSKDSFCKRTELPACHEKKPTDIAKVPPSRESTVFDSPALHSSSGNKQAWVKMVSPDAKVQAAAATASCETSATEGAVPGWPKDQPVKLRDFKSREERPLTPGLTVLDWERTLREAVTHSQPPAGFVLHECLQCGRTFKPDSLKVHMRGCHAINKPKPTHVSLRRVSL